MKRVLRPVYEQTGETTVTASQGREVTIRWERLVRWVPVGYARNAQDAKERFTPLQYGYGLILEEA